MSEIEPFMASDLDDAAELDVEAVDKFVTERFSVAEVVAQNQSWRFGHVIVDEAQDLTPMQWRMIMRRVRGRSLTIVGDLAQRRGAAANGWEEVLPTELAGARRLELTINYRSPREIHELAEAVLASFAPGLKGSRAIRSVGYSPTWKLVPSVKEAIADAIEDSAGLVGGQLGVITANPDELAPHLGRGGSRVRLLSPVQAKGLEFDAVILVEPAEIWRSPGGRSMTYVGLTRATKRLDILYSEDLPAPLRPMR